MNKKMLISVIAVLLLVLTFSFILARQGTGRAASEKEAFQMDGAVLMKYMGSSEVVKVPDSVRIIGYGAFEDNDYIKKVILPNGLESIEYNAFAECDNLLEIDIPDSVTKIGSAAFANCKSLCDVYIGKSVEDVGSGIFAGCSSLEDLDVSTKSTTLTCLDGCLMSADRTYIYQMLPGRKEPFYIMNERVLEIGQYAFWGCNHMEHVILSDKIQAISPYAFSNAANLKSVSMSFAVTEIGMKAFEDCVSLEQIYVPDSVIKIHDTAFDGCPKLIFYTADGTYAGKYAEEHSISATTTPIYSLSYADDVKKEYYEAIKEAEEKSEQEANAPKPVEVGSDVMGYTTLVGNNAVILMDSAGGTVISGVNAQSNDTLNEMADAGRIPANAFYGNDTLQAVEIPEGVIEIEKFAFARSSLKSVKIPEGTTGIGYAAFYHCDGLEEVEIPDSVTYIASNAFAHTAWLEDWYENSESDYLIVGDGVLLAYKGQKEDYEQPANVKFVACDLE